MILTHNTKIQHIKFGEEFTFESTLYYTANINYTVHYTNTSASYQVILLDQKLFFFLTGVPFSIDVWDKSEQKDVNAILVAPHELPGIIPPTHNPVQVFTHRYTVSLLSKSSVYLVLYSSLFSISDLLTWYINLLCNAISKLSKSS